MILNQFVLIYLTVLIFAMGLDILCTFHGVICIRQWHLRSDYEKCYALEKRIYFLMTVFIMLLIWRLLAIPLWFGTLKSLIPSIPGAMCLYGVVASSPVLLGSASIGQLVLPFLLVIWFTWHCFDQNAPIQPLLKSEVKFAIGIGITNILITGLEIGGFASIKPRPVHCCTSLFDRPQFHPYADHIMGNQAVLLAVTGMIIVAVVFGWLQYAAWKPAKSATVAWIITFATGIGFCSIIFLMIERLAPRILKLPFHHCPFCLLERSIPTLLTFITWYITLIFLTGAVWAVRLSGYKGGELLTWIKRKGKWFFVLQAFSLLWFIYHVV